MMGRMTSDDEAEGFGFIQPKNNGQEAIAVEHAGLRDLIVGQQVSFETLIDHAGSARSPSTISRLSGHELTRRHQAALSRKRLFPWNAVDGWPEQ